MYERNAIVLERYFYRIFDYKNCSNLRENYYNYRKFFECYGNFCDANENEEKCKQEFEKASKEVVKMQKTQEKLYNKGAKLEYSRYVIFNNIKEKVKDIEKHLNKVSEDISKNIIELEELGKNFVKVVENYNEKEIALKEAIKRSQNAKQEYNDIYEKAKNCYEDITEDYISKIQEFISSDNKDIKKELQSIFEENGKAEKNQFDPDVILNTINKSIEIYKSEMEVYLAGYDRIQKLFGEIEVDSVKIDKHKKYYRDSKAKVDFLNAEKEYIVQFLDNERIGAIYDKKAHRKLMLEACKKFVLDFEQIDKLYEIILKESAGRSTKKIYKENYNKKYIVELENASIEPNLDTGKMRQEAIAFVNLNYWRIEGMRSIYSCFEETVKTIYEKDLTEFIPEELLQKQDIVVETEEKVEKVETVETEKIIDYIDNEKDATKNNKKVKNTKIYYSSKIVLANAIYKSLQTNEFASAEEDKEENKVDEMIVNYEIPENVKAILENIEENDIEENDIEENELEEFDLSKLDVIDEFQFNNNAEENDDYEEESIIQSWLNEEEEKEEKKPIQEIKRKTGFFKKLVNFNSGKKEKA